MLREGSEMGVGKELRQEYGWLAGWLVGWFPTVPLRNDVTRTSGTMTVGVRRRDLYIT